MIVTAQAVKGGIAISEAVNVGVQGVTFVLTYKQAETLGYALLKLVEKHTSGK